MADTLIIDGNDGGMKRRFMDMQDGTKAEVVVSADRLAVAGGASTFRAISAASTNAAVLKASPAILYGIQISNLNALGPRVVKLYNQTGAPVAADVPAMTFAIPAGQCIDISRSRGVAFPNGLAIAISTSILDGVLAAVGAGDVTVNINFT